MRRLLAFLVLVLATAPDGYPQTAPPGARIIGRVVSADTGAPIPNVRVSIVPVPHDTPLVTTDGEGKLEFVALAPGSYTLSAAKSGYATSTLTSMISGPGEASVTLALAKGAAIAGRVLDDLGDPVSGATVMVEQLVERAGARSARDRRSVQTNDLGEYRVGSLPRGDYVVSRQAPVLTQVIRVNGNTVMVQSPPQGPRLAGGPEGFGPPRVFYPDTALLAEAAAISLKPGEERASIDLTGPRPEPPLTDLARAQDTSPVARDAEARVTSAIRGRVLGPAGPLAAAEVRLDGDAIRPLPAVFTDTLGQYEFVNLPAGSYTVSARKNRYVATTSRVRLAVDERHDRTDLTLVRTSAIAGQITDEFGDPVEGVTVRLHQIRFVSGRRRLVEIQGAPTSRTDDLGRFRLANLRPGSYVVAAYVGQLVAGQPGAADIPGYATTYFPGTAASYEAQAVTITASQDLEGVNVPLSRIATATIAGAASTSAGEPITGGIVLSPSRRAEAVSTTPMGAYITPDGSFEFRNVPPGQYVIQAYRGRIKSSVEGEFAALPLTLNGTSVRGLIVQTSAGSTVSGRFTFDGQGVPTTRNLSLSAVPSDGDLAPLDGNFARADVHDDWTFEMSGISGPRRLRLLQAPRGWGLKRILVHGVDATDTPLPFGTADQSLSDVEVVLTDRLTEVTGAVTDARNRPVADARVVAFPVDSDLWYDRSRFLKITASGEGGTFTVRDLPPGTYFLSAVDRGRASEQNGEWLNPELLQSLAPGAMRITLAEGDRVSASPRLTGP